MGEGALSYSFNLSPKVLADSPVYSSSHSSISHLYLYIATYFWVMFSLSVGAIRRHVMVLPSLKWTYIPTLLQMFLTFTEILGIRNHQVDVIDVVIAGIISPGPELGLCVTVFEAVPTLQSIDHPVGYLYLDKAFLICSSSRSSWGSSASCPHPKCEGVKHNILMKACRFLILFVFYV